MYVVFTDCIIVIHAVGPFCSIVIHCFYRVGKNKAFAQILILSILKIEILLWLILQRVSIKRAEALDRLWLYFKANNSKLISVRYVVSLNSDIEMVKNCLRAINLTFTNVDTLFEVGF